MAEKISIRVATVNIKDKKVLLVKSKYGDGEYYLFPGGGVEFGETLGQAGIRETLEETGFKVKIKKLIHINEYILEEGDKRSVTAFFLSQPIGMAKEELKDDNGKIINVEWINLNDLSNLDVRPKILADEIKKRAEGIKLGYSVDRG